MTETGFWTGSVTYSPVYAPGGITLSIGTGPDANGTSWIWQEIKGWDSPDVTGQVIQRTGDHGGWAASQFLAPRVMTLTVMASARTQALRDEARALFQQVMPVGTFAGDLATLTYNEPAPKQALFRRSGKIAEQLPTLTDAIWTANIVAPDPRKYSVTQSSVTAYLAGGSGGGGMVVPFTVPFTLAAALPPGAAEAVNSGKFEVRPVVTVHGPVTAPVIANAAYGMRVSFSEVVLAAGDTLAVDFDARAGAYNGAYRSADLSSAWWVLQPGSNTIEVGGLTVGTGAFFEVSWRNAWI